eukprot:5337944-Prymnesium_polylepis.1
MQRGGVARANRTRGRAASPCGTARRRHPPRARACDERGACARVRLKRPLPLARAPTLVRRAVLSAPCPRRRLRARTCRSRTGVPRSTLILWFATRRVCSLRGLALAEWAHARAVGTLKAQAARGGAVHVALSLVVRDLGQPLLDPVQVGERRLHLERLDARAVWRARQLGEWHRARAEQRVGEVCREGLPHIEAAEVETGVHGRRRARVGPQLRRWAADARVGILAGRRRRRARGAVRLVVDDARVGDVEAALEDVVGHVHRPDGAHLELRRARLALPAPRVERRDRLAPAHGKRQRPRDLAVGQAPAGREAVAEVPSRRALQRTRTPQHYCISEMRLARTRGWVPKKLDVILTIKNDGSHPVEG